MTGQKARSIVIDQIEAAGYRWYGSHENDDSFIKSRFDHRVTLTVSRWGRRVDFLTVISSFAMPTGLVAPAFHFDLGAQMSLTPGAAARWAPQQVCEAVADHVVPYLRSVSSPALLLDLLLSAQLKPMARGTLGVVQQGYYLAKWWRLNEALPMLRQRAGELDRADREKLSQAPWGRAEIAEVLLDGRDLPSSPARRPWGFGDQGDPRLERWFADTEARDHQSVPVGLRSATW
ncbi:MAG: hypothetical protein ACK5KU_08955 [Beutenbergiaceae bacterium]